VVILGEVGQNFAAGMTGGMAYIYDPSNTFMLRLNTESVVAERIASAHWEGALKALIETHQRQTNSPQAASILGDWETSLQQFWQVCPKEMLTRLAHPLNDEALVQPIKRQA
jgi:glutamate synthase (NADPH) large chain